MWRLPLPAFVSVRGLQPEQIGLLPPAGTAVTPLINNEVHLSRMNLATAAGQIRSGRLKAYAVTTDQRLQAFPDVMTMAEAGFAGIGSNNWNGLFAQSRTPTAIIASSMRAFTHAVTSAEYEKPLQET